MNPTEYSWETHEQCVICEIHNSESAYQMYFSDVYWTLQSEANQILQHYGHTRDDEAIGL